MAAAERALAGTQGQFGGTERGLELEGKIAAVAASLGGVYAELGFAL